MESLLTLLKMYGWQLFLVGILSSIVVGAVKTPIRSAVKKKYSSVDPTSSKYKKMETVFDICVVLGTYLFAFIFAMIYLFLAKMFNWKNLLASTIGVYAIQSACYLVWKKLGLRKILELFLEQIVKLFHKIFDRNKDGKISFEEATKTIKDFVKDGKLDVDGILKLAEKEIPNFAESVVKSISNEAGSDAEVNIKEETDKLKESVKDAVDLVKESITNEDKPGQISEVTGDTKVIKTNGNEVSIIKF